MGSVFGFFLLHAWNITTATTTTTTTTIFFDQETGKRDVEQGHECGHCNVAWFWMQRWT